MKSKKTLPKYNPDSTYKVTIVKNNGERIPKYFKGEEMPEVELKIKNRIGEIDHWFWEELKNHNPLESNS